MEYNNFNEIQKMQDMTNQHDSMQQPKMHAPEIRAATAMANVKRPLLETRNRFDYVNGFLGLWKEAIRYRLAVIALSIFSIWAFFVFPYILPFTLALILYYYNRRQHITKVILSSKRKVIEAG
ncbi:Uncharacterised protein [uncultured archaeon]|nr:Uncharacterised protein [uncultured archaeon]